MRPAKYRKDKPPTFVLKLYEMLQDSSNSEAIAWTKQNNGFLITNVGKFTEEILPKYFKHSNFTSFVRQLNMYDFSKMRVCGEGSQMENQEGYQNPLFRKNGESEFSKIKRKEVLVTRAREIVTYDDADHPNRHTEEDSRLLDRFKQVKEKQEQLQQICFKLISQNQILLAQNQELAHKVKKESRKKEKILQQVFRIIGVSISEFWDEFCENNESLEQKTNNFKTIYQMLMAFIDKNELAQIMKTLNYLIVPKGKAKIFKVVDPKEEANFLSNYSEQEIEEFINETNFLLEPTWKPNYQVYNEE